MSLLPSLVRRPIVHRMSFDGQLLARGFWLYGWRTRCRRGLLLYVGRTCILFIPARKFAI